MADSKRLVELAKFDEMSAGASTQIRDCALATLDSLYAELTRYHAHKTQTSAQDLYQHWAAKTITPEMWKTLQDYWSKQAARLQKSACSRGNGKHRYLRAWRHAQDTQPEPSYPT